MKAIMRRLRKIEDALAPPAGTAPFRVRFGHLMSLLPEDYVGERHIAIINRTPGESPNSEHCHFEERPGAAPPGTDEGVEFLNVYFVEAGPE